MKNLWILFLFWFAGFFSLSAQKIIACGEDKVYIINIEKSDADKNVIEWQWQTSEIDGISDSYKKWLIPLDECKPVDGGRKILLTSSSNATVLLDKKTKKVLFYAHTPMAHSATMLPRNRIAVALSTHPKGNSIEIYDLNKPEKIMFRDSLYSGHGLVWNDKREILYALGYKELRAYELENWKSDTPQLRLIKKWEIPGDSGHDLIAISNDELVITTGNRCDVFNIENETFSPFIPLADVRNVKSLNYNKKSGSLIYTKAEISWWTHHIYCENPDKVITINDCNLYKVRTYPK